MKNFLSAVLLTIGLAITTSPVLAANVANPFSTCMAQPEITSYYSGDDFVAYKYDGTNAEKMVAFFTQLFGSPPPAPVSVIYVGLDNEDHSIAFFFYNAKGCFVAKSDGWDAEETRALFESIDVQFPIGSTFFQIPGSGGNAPPGFRN